MSKNMNVAIIGATGAIGSEFTVQYCTRDDVANVYAFSRKEASLSHHKCHTHMLDITDESSIIDCLAGLPPTVIFDRIIVATGMLHADGVMPEKSLKELSAKKFEQLFTVNTIGPALIAKHFLQRIPKDEPSVFAALSARVGSISDNRLGGWYAYRASKSALNMVLKNTSIEIQRRYKKACIIGLHPGTVDSDLSKPFQANVSESKLFTAEYSVSQMVQVIETIDVQYSGKCMAYDGSEIEY